MTMSIPLSPIMAVRFVEIATAIRNDLSWESLISNLASKASRQLCSLCRAKYFFGTPVLLTTHKAFILNLMEYCSTL